MTVIWIVAAVLGCLALLFQLIGLLTPAWVYTSGEGDSTMKGYDLQTGLWYRTKCSNVDCRRISFGEEFLTDPPNLSSNRGLAVVGFLLCLLAVALFLVNRACWKRRTLRQITLPTSIVLCFLSFVFTIIPVGRTISEIDELGTKLDARFRNMPYRVVLRSPYSLALFAVGSFLILVAAIPMVINLVFYRNRELDDDEYVDRPVTFASKPLPTEKMMAEPRKGDRLDSYAHRPPSKEELDDRGRHYKTEREYTVGLPSANVSLDSKRDRGESRGDYVEPNRFRGKPKSPGRYTDDYYDDHNVSDSENPDDYEYPERTSHQSYAHMDQPKTGKTRVSNPGYARSSVI